MGAKFSIIPARALFDTRLTQEDVLFLNVLCQFTDDDGRCFPSFQLLSATYSPLVGREEPYSKAAISARMARLEEFGYVRDGGHRQNAMGGYSTKNWQVLYDTQLPDAYKRSVQKTPPKVNTSVNLNTVNSERNDPVLTLTQSPPEQNERLECWNELQKEFPLLLNALQWDDFDKLWQKFPDKRRHEYAIARVRKSNPKKFKWYLEDFAGYDPAKPKTWGEGVAPPPPNRPRFEQKPHRPLRFRND